MMKVLIIYDSVFGNTDKIACAISSGFASNLRVDMVRVTEIKPEQLTGVNLLIVGSPTRQFNPTPATTNFIQRIAANGLKDVGAAAFDTRISIDDIDLVCALTIT